ncbi:MAG: hypothetical protein MHM6MM_001003 [Cercozoa sp. M6MM]
MQRIIQKARAVARRSFAVAEGGFEKFTAEQQQYRMGFDSVRLSTGAIKPQSVMNTLTTQPTLMNEFAALMRRTVFASTGTSLFFYLGLAASGHYIVNQFCDYVWEANNHYKTPEYTISSFPEIIEDMMEDEEEEDDEDDEEEEED